MGWGRTLLLGDVGNRLDIGDCEREVASLRDNLRRNLQTDVDQEREIRELRNEVDELKLCVTSLTRLLTAKGIVDGEDLQRLARVIDDDDAVRFLDESR